MPISELEARFEILWESLYPTIDLVAEYKGIPNRRFRFDYAHPESKVAIELNGGTWAKMGHSSGTGIKRDYEKLNLATAIGWRVFQLSSDMIDQYWLDLIARSILSTHA